MRRLPSLAFSFVAIALVVLVSGLATRARQAAPPSARPGVLGNGVTQLPNGWRIAPTGRHAPIGDLPLNMVWSPDGRYLIVTNNGWSRPTLTIFDTAHFYVKETVPVANAWLGLAWDPSGKRLFSSGAAENVVNEFAWDGGSLKQGSRMVLGSPAFHPTFANLNDSGFIGGIAITPDGRRLFAVKVFGTAVVMVDVARRKVLKTAQLTAEPYAALLSGDARRVFVSLWGGSKVLVFDAGTLAPLGEVPVGEHPNAMVESKDGSRLYVACASTNAVWVVDTAALKSTEQVGVSLYPKAPPGTTPNGLALSPDGKTLLVANADNNTVAVVDVSSRDAGKVRGFIPTGWYPTTVTFDREGKRIYVLNGKGLSPSANPRGPNAGGDATGQYIGQLLQGALSEIETPDEATLQALTKRAYEITSYDDETKLAPRDAPVASPVPRRVGDPSPIKNVFYIIRENRTYDQVFGDIASGNGDPTLTLFGEPVTPNAHALAREFVLLDNFYVDAEVSFDGHAFSTGAYATDVVEKIWPTNYGDRGGIYLSEGEGPLRNPFGNLSAPPQGYIWDMAKKAGVTVRSYGEFAHRDLKTRKIVASVPGLEGFINTDYEPWDLDVTENSRVDVWLKEFQEFERTGNLPRLNIIRLGNDHTAGTRVGSLTPRAMVAENDVALGRIVEAVSHSKFWPESAIFVLEDDAQDGPDHVDAHRSPALVVSPFAKRRVTDSTLYSTTSMLRTMELILGLEPMSQYDAAARPMYNAFQAESVVTPYSALPARVSITEKNTATAWGAEASRRMEMREADLTPERELNEIVWRSVKGADSPMPPPRRAAFIASTDADEDEAEHDRDEDEDEER